MNFGGETKLQSMTARYQQIGSINPHLKGLFLMSQEFSLFQDLPPIKKKKKPHKCK